MSEPISKPKGLYKQPMQGEMTQCPHCGKVLDQHFAPSGAKPNINVNVGMPEILPPVAIPPSAKMVDDGDVFVPAAQIPTLARETEHMRTGQANQTKAMTHTIPGMQTKPKPQAAIAALPKMQHPQADALATAMDNPIIGGKITICVLLFGTEHHALHRRCLNSIVSTVPPSRMDLRVATNQVGLETVNYLRSLPITKIYPDQKARRKYPAMRQMFYDKKDPIDTRYVVWYDDDSYVRNQAWLALLCECIKAQDAKEKVGMYGSLMWHPLKHPQGKDPKAWFRAAKWYRDQPFRDQRGRGTPNGNKIHFCVGGFWAISLEAMKACDIPCTRLNHNGGDICIGEQLWQGGYAMKSFNGKKEFIHTSASPRRGFKERFPWYR
jgi:hypothetical protein